MHIKGLLLFMLIQFCFIITGFCQNKKDTIYPKLTIIIGCESGGFGFKGENPTTGEIEKFASYRFAPHFSFYYKNKIGWGLLAEYEFVRSNFTSQPPLYGFGIYSRYYFPYRMPYEYARDHIMFYGEASFNIDNYHLIKGGFQRTDKIENSKVKALIGFSWRIFAGLNMDYAFRYEIDLTTKGGRDFNGRVGLEYHF